jgi:thiol-disulfide isomerase/thioredoxin
MNRRRLLSALAGFGLTGGSLVALRSDVFSGTGNRLPTRVETLDAPGSSPGKIRVPRTDRPTLVDLFATWCPPCERQMDPLAAVIPEYDDRVAFVSVTNERIGGTLSRSDIARWWERHDGRWPVALDPESVLMSTLGAEGLPYLALVDTDGTVLWAHSGVATERRLRRGLKTSLADR